MTKNDITQETNIKEKIRILFSQLDEYTKGAQLEELTPESLKIILNGIAYVRQTQENLREKADEPIIELEHNLLWLADIMEEKNINKISRKNR